MAIVKIQFRRDTTVDWMADNPILSIGEPAYDITLKTWKIGDGVTEYNVLPNGVSVQDLDTYVTQPDLAEALALKVNILDIVDNLTSVLANVPLSAKQGKVLKDQIDTIDSLLTSNNINLDTVQELADAIEALQISLPEILVNDLTTGGVTLALTAEMGKLLNDTKVDLVADKSLTYDTEIARLLSMTAIFTTELKTSYDGHIIQVHAPSDAVSLDTVKTDSDIASAISNSKKFTHIQGVPSTIWNITHELNRYPSVTVADSAGTVVIGEVLYGNGTIAPNELNEITLYFSAGFSGYAYLN